MIHADMLTSMSIAGAASVLGLGVMGLVQTDQPKLGYALSLYRWAFLCIASLVVIVVTPAPYMSAVVQGLVGLIGVGVVLLGWAFRQLSGRRTHPWAGWVLGALVVAVLWGSAIGLSPRAYELTMTATLALISVSILVDQAVLVWRGAARSTSEWALVMLAGVFAINWVLLWAYALIEPGPYPVHWIHAPSWWQPVCAIGFALLPLTVSAVVFAIINERLAQQLRARALSDELTGALSRRGLRELGERLLVSQRKQYPLLAVLMLDIDHFKRVNDSYGHLAGDEVLRNLVHVIHDRLRNDALLARFGGEEFIVLLPVRRAQEAKIVAERLRQAVEASAAQTTAGLVKVTVSLGVAFHKPERTLEQTVSVADACLYHAKQAGRNRVVVDHGDGSAAPVSHEGTEASAEQA